MELNGNFSTSVVITISPFANITWIECENITVVNLSFIFSGSRDSEPFRAALFFRRCNNIYIASTSFKGKENSTFSIALRGHTSNNIVISNSFFSQCGHSFGGGVTVYLCQTLITNTTFVDNIAEISGGAIYTYDGILQLSDNTFMNNSAQTSGGVIYCIHGRLIISGHNLFSNNNVILDGGTISSDSCAIEIGGESYFAENRAEYLGGAISIFKGSFLSVSGNVKFYRNFAGWSGGAIFSFESRSEVIGNISIDSNAANISGGGGISISHQSSFIGIGAYLSNNTVLHITGFGGGISCTNASLLKLDGVSFEGNGAASSGGAISVSINSVAYINNLSVWNNEAKIKGGGIDIDLFSIVTLSGKNYFINNSIELAGGGALSISRSQVHLKGSTNFIDNSADLGGAISIFHFSLANISGGVSFLSNNARLGGAVCIWAMSSVEYQQRSKCIFRNNSAERGGAMFALDSSILMAGKHRYIHNFANLGGAMTLMGKSKFRLMNPLEALFESNRAEHVGGAIYFDDPISTLECDKTIINKYLATTYCLDPSSQTGEKCSTNKECFFEIDQQIPLNVSTWNSHNVTLTFVNNTATTTGTVLYGGMLDDCRVYVGEATMNDCGLCDGGVYSNDPISVFKSISIIDNSTSSISSAPLRVCLCRGDTFDCDLRLSLEIVTGTEFVISAVAVGQGNTTVPSDIRVALDTNVHLDPAQAIQHAGATCTDIKYRVYSAKKQVALVIYPDGPCRDIGIARNAIDIKILPCPQAFVTSGIECVCESRLQQFTSNCNVEERSITRKQNSFWIAPHQTNGTYKGLIIHSSGCPLDYCETTLVNVTLDNADIQCAFNHSGILCGSCKENFGIALGSLHCFECSNAHLTLILPFALSGIVLVVLLLSLQLTVAKGSINGLIFYANTVQMNNHVFFPPQEGNILTVFIAWLNLDLGIESCFYDGMDIYAYTWLQYAFPFYIWLLIAVIILLSKYSHTVSRTLGSNPIAVLSTLILLSYAKLLRTIITSLSYTILEYPNNISQYVWLYDGQILYFQTTRHIILGAFAIVVLTLLFMPYTILMLTSHKLYAYSNKRLFSWLNRIMPFLDTYHAPFKQEHRYWTGLLLLIRCSLFLTFALNALGSSSVNLIAITSVTAGLMVIAWIRGKLYLNVYNDILEASFLLNLCIFSAATYHVNEIGGNQAGLAYTSAGIAFLTFIGIMLVHIYLRLKVTTYWQSLRVKVTGVVEFIRKRNLDIGRQTNESELKEVQNSQSPKISVTEIKIDRVSQYTT